MSSVITILPPEKSWEWTGVFELVPADYQSRGGTYSYPVVVLAAGETKGGKAVTQVRADDVHSFNITHKTPYHYIIRSAKNMSRNLSCEFGNPPCYLLLKE